MKKTLGLLLFLICLLAAWYYLDKSKQQQMGMDVSDRAFAIENMEDIGRILIVSRRQDPTVLVKEGGLWYVGKEKHRARMNAVNNLLKVIRGLKLMYIPAKQAKKNILNEMSLIGVKVQIYDKSDKLMKSYTIGGSPMDEIGTHMLMDGGHQPYTMHLPSLEGSVRGRYEMKNIDWRDRAVFRHNITKIDSIIADYPKNKSESFAVSKSALGYNVHSTDKYNNTTKDEIDFNRVKAYVEGYDEVFSEYIENTNKHRDSLTLMIPFAKYTVVSNGERSTYSLFPLDDFTYEEETTDINANLEGTRYFVENSTTKDLYLVQHRLIKQLMRGYSYFLKE